MSQRTVASEADLPLSEVVISVRSQKRRNAVFIGQAEVKALLQAINREEGPVFGSLEDIPSQELLPQ
jgi:hypothetical protein